MVEHLFQLSLCTFTHIIYTHVWRLLNKYNLRFKRKLVNFNMKLTSLSSVASLVAFSITATNINVAVSMVTLKTGT